MSIALGAAFVATLIAAPHLFAAPHHARPASNPLPQAIFAGTIGCFPDGEFNSLSFRVDAGLGVLPYRRYDHSSLGLAVDLSEDCTDLIPVLAEQVPPHICEIGNSPDARGPLVEAFTVVCTGRFDRVISAVGKMTRVVSRLGQP
jgi:hypothetical protein